MICVSLSPFIVRQNRDYEMLDKPFYYRVCRERESFFFVSILYFAKPKEVTYITARAYIRQVIENGLHVVTRVSQSY